MSRLRQTRIEGTYDDVVPECQEIAEEPQDRFWPQCGKESPPENKFCGAFGSQL